MSMLEHFFDIRRDSRAIFEGLEISENTSLCSEWMNQYPTIFISFKEVVGINFEIAFDRLKALVKELFRSHRYLLEKIQDDEKAEFKRICSDSATYSDISNSIRLKLVNKEIKSLFVKTISEWFKENIVGEDRTVLFNAVWQGDADTISDEVSGYLNDTISYFDYHENFYHAFLAGLFSGVKGIGVESNRESGTGRTDVVVKYPRKRYVAIFELKKAETVFKYGVAFHEKNCLVKKG